MKYVRDTAIGQPEGMFWGMTPEGDPILMIVLGGERVKVVMTAQQAKDACCAGIYASYIADQQREQAAGPALKSAREVNGFLVDAAGNPIVPTGRG